MLALLRLVADIHNGHTLGLPVVLMTNITTSHVHYVKLGDYVDQVIIAVKNLLIN